VGMNWSVGWPDIGTAAEMGAGVQACDYLGLHEYSAPTMQQEQGFLCLRYRRTVEELEAAGFTVPPILVSECGIDGGVIGVPKTGWRTYCDQFSCYLDQLKWYSSEIDMDNVQAATIFTVCSWDWADFAITEAEAIPLADWIAQDEPPAPPARSRGIDVSQWQGEIDWQAVADSGVEFAIIRATVGDADDPYWQENYRKATEAGLKLGAYHYLMAFVGGQAGTFARAVAGKDLPLGCWCDIEDDNLTADKCAAFFQYADPQIEHELGIYTRASFFDRFGVPSWAEGRKLWVADWRDVAWPAVPIAWDEWDWTFWQQTSDGAIDGIEGRVDLDVYNGTFDDGEEEIPDMEIKVFDYERNERDWAWLLAEFGPLDLRLAEPVTMPDGSQQMFRLVECREQYGPANINVNLDDLDGSPLADSGDSGIVVAWYWPGAPLLPDLPPATSIWEPNAVYGPTNGEGVIGFAMSEDAYYYWPDRDEVGPHGVWVLAPAHPSDGIFGLGMIAGTDHRHINLRFQLVTIEDAPEPPEPEPGDDEVLVELRAIRAAVEKIAAHFA